MRYRRTDIECFGLPRVHCILSIARLTNSSRLLKHIYKQTNQFITKQLIVAYVTKLKYGQKILLIIM